MIIILFWYLVSISALILLYRLSQLCDALCIRRKVSMWFMAKQNIILSTSEWRPECILFLGLITKYYSVFTIFHPVESTKTAAFKPQQPNLLPNQDQKPPK